MKRWAMGLSVLVVWVGCCLGQSMVEHAAAAAVGTAGSVGGKAISNGLDKVFGKVEAATREAADPAPKEITVPVKTPGKATGGSVPMPSGAAHRRGLRRAVAARDAEAAPMPVVESAAAVDAARWVPSVRDFAMLAPGATKREVTERLGAPSYKIVIPDDGHLVEIYRYANRGSDLGRVRVVDGTVAEVKAAQP